MAMKKGGWKKLKDGRSIPWNAVSPKEPILATCVANNLVVQKGGDIHEIVLDTQGRLPYVEGQSIAVVPPGATQRLYSIASRSVNGCQRVSLCVKRKVEIDGQYGEMIDGQRVYKGVSSNFLADLPVGAQVQVAGPVGAELLLPEKPDGLRYIFMATGTGVAPFRAQVETLLETCPNAEVWLFVGVPYAESLIYHSDFLGLKAKYPRFQYHFALSREGGRGYVHHRLAEIFPAADFLEDEKTHLYVCGMKGMEKGLAQIYPHEWPTLKKTLKKAGRLHLEVY